MQTRRRTIRAPSNKRDTSRPCMRAWHGSPFVPTTHTTAGSFLGGSMGRNHFKLGFEFWLRSPNGRVPLFVASERKQIRAGRSGRPVCLEPGGRGQGDSHLSHDHFFPIATRGLGCRVPVRLTSTSHWPRARPWGVRLPCGAAAGHRDVVFVGKPTRPPSSGRYVVEIPRFQDGPDGARG